MSVTDLKHEIEEGWSNVPAASMCLQIIDFMSAHKPQELRMLTFPVLIEAVGANAVTHDMITAIAILVSSPVHILDAKAILFEDEDEVPISAECLAEARSTGELENPATGLMVADFEKKIIPYFEATERYFKLITNG